MANPVQLSTLVKPTEPMAEEKDRYPLQAGIRFVITDFVLSNSKNMARNQSPRSMAMI